MPPLAAFFAGAFVTLAAFATIALAFGATASPFKHKARAFCKALMPRSISASSCFVLIKILLYESTRDAERVSRIRACEYRDTLSSVFGRHLLRYGREFRSIFIALSVGAPKMGSLSFNSLLAFTEDNPYYQSLVVNPATGLPTAVQYDYSSRETEYFVQNDWKVNMRQTVDAGIRWNYFGGPSERRGELSSITFGPGTTFDERFAGASVGKVSRLFNAQRTNFPPRVGLAYDPFWDGGSSIRAGFSLSYEPVHGLTLLSGTGNPPFAVMATLQPNAGYGTNILYGIPVPNNPEFKTTLNAQGGIVSPAGTPPIRISPWMIDPGLKTQYRENWFLSLQHEFAESWIAELGYIGTNGINLERRDDVNLFDGDLLINNGVQKRLNHNWSGVAYATNGVTSNYNAMTAEIRHQAGRTLSLHADYRWSKWFDDESDTASSFWADNSQGSRGAQDANCLKCERGRSEFDIPKRFTASSCADSQTWCRFPREHQDLQTRCLHPAAFESHSVDLFAADLCAASGG